MNPDMKNKDVQLESIDPATGKKTAEYKTLTEKELQSKIQASEVCWQEWKSQSFTKRENLLEELSANLIKNKESLSEVITKEMGKPLNQSIREIEKCALLCRYYKEHGQRFLSDREEFLHYKKSYVHYAPLGGSFGIMPWNFPFWQVFRFAIPSLTAGNAVFLKHAENVTDCALTIERILHESGWPKGIFTTLLIGRSQVESVIANPFIKIVSFTGSAKTGQHIAELCGRYLKKNILELGGSDPYIVLEDADISKSAEQIITSRLNNSGQSCIAAKRVIVEQSIYKELIQSLINQLTYKSISHPFYNPDVGPLAKKEFVTQLENIRDKDIKEGAKILFEKQASSEDNRKGFYFPITLMGDCSSLMECAQQELFGPLLPVFCVENSAKALEMANKTRFGLGAVIFTKNEELGEKWAKDQLNAGSCFVNGMVKSNPSLPFGGINKSGYGRELSVEGIREFTNIKTIAVCH
ncbi:MAG: aldehyde dehydrogenase family protein [Oligoflexia bacterium]|nr:aldehyde dehydrogenase family protein [Oligoflexia bacterium]